MSAEPTHTRRSNPAGWIVLLICVTGLLAPGLMTQAGEPTKALDQFRFSVWYNDKRIGEHEFAVQRTDDALLVRSNATFEIKVLFVPVYRYRHEAEEHWRDGCLTYLLSDTNDNGQHFHVLLQAQANGLHLEQTQPTVLTSELAGGCAATFAYWDLARLQRGALINAQTGELAAVTLSVEGTETIDGMPATKYLLTAQGTGTIELWYRQSDNRWVMLRTNRDGGTLTYRSEV